MQGSNSYKVDLHQQGELQSELKRAGFRFSRSQHSFWRATDGRYTLTLFKSSRLLIQGKDPGRVALLIFIRTSRRNGDPRAKRPQL
jgi:ribonuclease HIII